MNETQEISLSPVTDSPDFPDAMLTMNEPAESADLSQGDVQFSYDVKNYQLATQTADADMKMCANSPQGQHIHLILNNQPYTAHYEPQFSQKLDPGHYLSFLSRSYHESIKTPEAYVLRQFNVGDSQEEVDLTQPMLFYSRPKGTYEGKDAENLLLDFYLVNTEISGSGNKVRATINGKEFMIDEWQPYIVKGLPMGENTIKLELVDGQGNLVESPFNSVSRTFTLKEASQPSA